MEERGILLILSIIMIILAVFAALIATSGGGASNFNFYSSTISANGTTVSETLHFLTDNPLHTLFRTIASPITNSSGNNTVSISTVRCSAGTPYYRTFYGTCDTFLNGSVSNICLANTENNEYGCTFGDVLGFSYGTDYVVGATYTLHPANLFLINGTYYTKFVAYSANNHYDLKLNQNFFVTGGITAQEFTPNEDVIVYIPYYGSTAGYNIINQNGFGLSNGFNYTAFTINFIIFLLPLIALDGIYLFIARQKNEPPPPTKLSDIPNERKPWQVSVYFNPPLMEMDKNFYSALMLDFYRRKIIDIKYVDGGFMNKKAYVKILTDTADMDDIEKRYLQFLKDAGNTVRDQDRSGDYFDINKANYMLDRMKFYSEGVAMLQAIKDQGKSFLDSKGYALFAALSMVMFIIGIALATFILSLSAIFLLIVSGILYTRTPLLMRYNQDFYEEYMQWQAFKHGLSYLSSVKDAKADAVVEWEMYLVYATALGAADTVLEQMKNLGMIDKTRLNNYNGVYIGSTMFARGFAASGAGGHAGGGGVGGGGVGGGGGGGR